MYHKFINERVKIDPVCITRCIFNSLFYEGEALRGQQESLGKTGSKAERVLSCIQVLNDTFLTVLDTPLDTAVGRHNSCQ